MSRGFISLIFGLGGGTVLLLSSFETCSLLILQTLSTEYTGTLDSGIGLIFSCSESKKMIGLYWTLSMDMYPLYSLTRF